MQNENAEGFETFYTTTIKQLRMLWGHSSRRKPHYKPQTPIKQCTRKLRDLYSQLYCTRKLRIFPKCTRRTGNVSTRKFIIPHKYWSTSSRVLNFTIVIENQYEYIVRSVVHNDDYIFSLPQPKAPL